MIHISKVHHIAIICSNYEASKEFYTKILGLTIVAENYREDRDSYKLDLALNGEYIIEIFSFKDRPERPSQPEALGLRHLAFAVPDINTAIAWLSQNNIASEPVRVDAYTGKKFTFFADPDGLPLEFYES
ncbi:SMU1112c/YaeR family gloxylase I-like metalloprotein [Flavobacterium rhizosphaerae]|uniref:VOC family protein n=1 Tax=Flavobacterium rhizosphaerae TaxID=3163298 RepID=A0ABW8YVF9_9FLAO